MNNNNIKQQINHVSSSCVMCVKNQYLKQATQRGYNFHENETGM